MLAAARSPENCPASRSQCGFPPVELLPFSLWSWQDAIKAVFLERVNILEEYDRTVRSPSFRDAPAFGRLAQDLHQAGAQPAFTRFNVFLRDRFECQSRVAATSCSPRRASRGLTVSKKSFSSPVGATSGCHLTRPRPYGAQNDCSLALACIPTAGLPAGGRHHAPVLPLPGLSSASGR